MCKAFLYYKARHVKGKDCRVWQFLVQWNLYKADTIGAKKSVRFIEIFSKIVWPQSKAIRSSSYFSSYRGVRFIVCVRFIEILLHKLKQLLYIKRGLSFLTKWGRCYKVELLLQSSTVHKSNERNEGGQQILATGSLFTSNLPSDRQFASRNSW